MTNIDWHAGFVPAMKLELRDYEDNLTYDEEYVVDNRGHRIDLLVIKNERDYHIPRPICHIFNKYNIIEYKSPGDNPNLGDFYNTISYGCLYLRDSYKYDLYGRDAFTLTLISSGYPRELFKQLKRDQVTYTKTERGIYVFVDMIPFRTQLVVLKERPSDYHWLKKLTKNADISDVADLSNNTATIIGNAQYRSYAETVADVFFKANRDLLDSINELEDKNMCEVVEQYFAEKNKEKFDEMSRTIASQERQISKKDAQIKQLKAQLAKLQAQSAMM